MAGIVIHIMFELQFNDLKIMVNVYDFEYFLVGIFLSLKAHVENVVNHYDHIWFIIVSFLYSLDIWHIWCINVHLYFFVCLIISIVCINYRLLAERLNLKKQNTNNHCIVKEYQHVTSWYMVLWRIDWRLSVPHEHYCGYSQLLFWRDNPSR